MSTGTPKKRSDRVSQLELPPSRFSQALSEFREPDVLWRLAVCIATVVLMWAMTGRWQPAFPYRTSQVTQRDIVARVDFEVESPQKTREKERKFRAEFQQVYLNEPASAIETVEELSKHLREFALAESVETIEPAVLDQFLYAFEPVAPFAPAAVTAPAAATAAAGDAEQQTPNEEAVARRTNVFAAMKQALNGQGIEKTLEELRATFENIREDGLLRQLTHTSGSQEEIQVRTGSKTKNHIDVDDVSIDKLLAKIEERLGPELALPIDDWLDKHLETTLTWDENESAELLKKQLMNLEPEVTQYLKGVSQLAAGGERLGPEQIELLKQEHVRALDTMAWPQRLARVAASFAMYLALYALLGAYIYFREPSLIRDFSKFLRLQMLVLITITFAKICANDSWQSELVPMMLFAMTASIAYRQEIALLLSSGICLITVISLGQGLNELVILAATLATTVILLRNVRSRTKLIYIGMAAGAVAFLTALSVGIVRNPGMGLPLVIAAGWYGVLASIAGVIMTGILPFVEKGMELQTDISLLELGDVAHPLLQELVRRAPGTYNHSISVASVAEAAADSIGANGLLCRVGAYFHDIGKMMKPQYFIENQGTEGSRHEALLPAMSTLIIIAHVKDGADLARQHNLPQPLIDFILQHHGTTLVEYFFDRASKQSEDDPDASEVDETTYRYPGPKPQTREAAVLMLSDAVESASRSLQEPAPSRIESLVHELASKRLLDGQFDECGLTFKELRIVEKSIVKSLTAMYHGRVKYPDQQTA
jgi:putative nucleotidyltransferase with HDIG domain